MLTYWLSSGAISKYKADSPAWFRVVWLIDYLLTIFIFCAGLVYLAPKCQHSLGINIYSLYIGRITVAILAWVVGGRFSKSKHKQDND